MSTVEGRRDMLRLVGAGFASLFVLSMPDVASAAPSPGDPCKNKGRTRRVGSVSLKCEQRGGALVWVRVRGAQVTPPPKPVSVAAIASNDLVVGAPAVVVVTDSTGQKRYVGLVRTATGVSAFVPNCTHQGYLLEPRAGEWYCDYHGSRFGAAEGEVLEGPARSALRRYDVTERDGTVFVSL